MKKLLLCCSAAAFCLFANNAFAGDTNELLDTGVVEIIPVASLDNIHDGKPGFSTSATVGYGIADFMTIFTGFSASTEKALNGADFGFDVMALFTPVDTEHFDMDFMLDLAYHGDYGEFNVTPTLEFNIDSADDMSGVGFYLRFGLPIYSGAVTASVAEGEEGEPSSEIKSDLAVDLTFGFYFSLMEGHQLFLEGGFSVVNLAENLGDDEDPCNGNADISGGYVSLGYNVTLFDNFELTPEFAVYLPNKDVLGDYSDSVTYGLSIGGVFDMVKIHE